MQIQPFPDWLVSPLPCCHSALVPPPSRLQLEVQLFVVKHRDGSGARCHGTLLARRFCCFSDRRLASFAERTAARLVVL